MKILILSPNFHTSKKRFKNKIFAPRDYIYSLTDELVKRGHQVQIASAPDAETKALLISGDAQLQYKTNFKLYRQTYRRNLLESEKRMLSFRQREYYELDLISRAINFARQEKYDIIHADYPLVHFFEDFSTVPIVYTLHDSLPDKDTLDYWILTKYSHHQTISISNNQRKGLPPVNFIGTVLHGIDLTQFIFQDRVQDHALGFIGRLVPDKGAHTAVQVSNRMNIPLNIATEISYQKTKYYRQEIAPHLKSGLTNVSGYLQKKEKISFFHKIKSLLFPIEWEEPFGLVMIEAMACGTPVIAFARGSVPEILADGKTGFIVNSSPENIRGSYIVRKTGIEGLIEAVRRLNSLSKDEYKAMRLACREHVEEKFTVEEMAQGYERVYRDAITNYKLRIMEA